MGKTETIASSTETPLGRAGLASSSAASFSARSGFVNRIVRPHAGERGSEQPDVRVIAHVLDTARSELPHNPKGGSAIGRAGDEVEHAGRGLCGRDPDERLGGALLDGRVGVVEGLNQ